VHFDPNYKVLIRQTTGGGFSYDCRYTTKTIQADKTNALARPQMGDGGMCFILWYVYHSTSMRCMYVGLVLCTMY
jgi:hypothetical protein